MLRQTQYCMLAQNDLSSMGKPIAVMLVVGRKHICEELMHNIPCSAEVGICSDRMELPCHTNLASLFIRVTLLCTGPN